MILPSIRSRIQEPRVFSHNGLCRPMLALLSESVDTLQDTNSIYNYIGPTLIAMALPFQKYAASLLAGKPRHDQILRERFLNYVDSRFDNPDLTIDSIALYLKCSRRHLYAAFEQTSTRPADAIMTVRLKHARSALLDKAQSHKSVSEIAFSNGFRSVAHFSRAFKSCYKIVSIRSAPSSV